MQAVPLLRICAVNATDAINGYPFTLALIKKALDSNLDVYALLFLHLRKDLPSLFKDNSRFTALECLDVGSLESVRQRLSSQNMSRNSLVFIDSLSVLIEQFSLPSTSWFLTQIAELSLCVLVLMCGLEDDDWKRIDSIASSVFELEARNGVAVCKTSMKKKNGTAITKIEQFSISSDFSLEVSPYVERDPTTESVVEQLVEQASIASTSSGQTSNNNSNNNLLGKLPFDIGLNLSEKERNAKARVQLPYMAAQTQKGLVALNISAGKKVRAGGQILYTPDKEDDFDESDPDDDLTI